MTPLSLPAALLLAKATLLLVVALGAAAWLRRSTAGTRHLIWLTTLGGLLALPLLGRVSLLNVPLLPAVVEMPTLDVGHSTFDVKAPTVDVPSAAVANPSAGSGQAAQRPTSNVEASTPDVQPSTLSINLPSPLVLALALWAAVALALLGWLAAGALAVRRIVRGAVPLDGDEWTTPLFEVADRLGLDDAPRLIASDRVEMAFACGIVRPTIVLPMSAREWSDDRRRAVLFHELAHVRRRDLLGHTLGRFACAMYWFHPLVWTAARKLRAESERACDDLVLACGARPTDYAQHLLEMVTSVRSHGAPAVALPMARPREFEGRMLAILDPSIRRAEPGRRERAGILLSLGLLALSLAAATPVRRAAQQPVMAQGRSDTAREARRDAVAPELSPAPRLAASPISAVETDARAEAAARARHGEPVDDAEWKEWKAAEKEKIREQKLEKTVQRQVTQTVQRTFTSGGETRELTPQDTARIAIFLNLLRTDKDAEVRKTAAWALHGARSVAGVTRALASAVRSDADANVRETSAWALGGTSDAEALAALAFALRNDRDEDVRTTSAWALGNSRTAETGALAAAAADPSADVRRAAIWALGNLDVSSAPPQVVAALQDKDDDVRVVAAWTLGQIADASTRPAIVNAFLSSKDKETREAAIWALLHLGEVPRSVIDAALASTDSDLRVRAVQMLAHGRGSAWPWPWPWPWPRPQP